MYYNIISSVSAARCKAVTVVVKIIKTTRIRSPSVLGNLFI